MARLLSPRLGNGTKMISRRQIMGEAEKTSIYMTNGLISGVAALGDQAHEFTQAIYKSMGVGLIPRSYLRQANRQLAIQAQEAIEAGWRSRLPVGAPSYRAGSDPKKSRLSGHLGRALSNQEEMIKGTTDRGISFINNTLLNEEARHWYRVNYGAWGPKAILRRPKPYPVTVGGHTLFVLRDEAQPARNSWLPRGYRREGYTWFAPTEGPADVHGGGTRAAVFTDLGFQSVAENLDPTYDNMFRAYLRDKGTADLEVHGINVVVGGPRPTVTGPRFAGR